MEKYETEIEVELKSRREIGTIQWGSPNLLEIETEYYEIEIELIRELTVHLEM